MYIHTYILCTIYIVHMYNMYKNVYIYICVSVYFHDIFTPLPPHKRSDICPVPASLKTGWQLSSKFCSHMTPPKSLQIAVEKQHECRWKEVQFCIC